MSQANNLDILHFKSLIFDKLAKDLGLKQGHFWYGVTSYYPSGGST